MQFELTYDILRSMLKSFKKIRKKLLTKIRRGKKGPARKPDKRKITLGLVIIVLFSLLYYFKSLFVAALVNSQLISRFSVIRQLEKRQGKEALESLIVENLILQEATKQKIRTTQEEINQEIDKLEKNFQEQGQDLDQLLSLQKMSRDDLQKQIRIQKLIEKMLGEKVSVSEEEIDEYLESNQDLLPQNVEAKELRETVKQQLKQQKLGENLDAWLMELKERAKIRYFVNY